jgi:hypothetical protein
MLHLVDFYLIGKYALELYLLLECNTALEICVVSEFYAEKYCSCIPTFRDGLLRPNFRVRQSKKKLMDRIFENGTDRLS